MAAGPRSLLAFWIGGAGATTDETQAGVRSLLAPWIGGASAAPEAETQAGVRSLLAPWIGGAGAASAAAEQAAVRSLLAFWLGGAAAGTAVEPPTPQPFDLRGGGRRLPIPPDLVDRMRRQLIEEDEVIVMVLLAALPGLLRRH